MADSRWLTLSPLATAAVCGQADGNLATLGPRCNGHRLRS